MSKTNPIVENIGFFTDMFEKITCLDTDSLVYRALVRNINKANEEQLKVILDANIRFASKLAYDRLVSRKPMRIVK